jgi:hypothetical protein
MSRPPNPLMKSNRPMEELLDAQLIAVAGVA